MEEIITKGNLDTYTQGLKGVLSSMGEAIQNSGSSSEGEEVTVKFTNGATDPYVVISSGTKTVGTFYENDTFTIPYGVKWTVTPHDGNVAYKQETYTADKMAIDLYADVTGLEAIDLGLPSGTLWADKNIGASNNTAAGLYFSWGNVEGHSTNSGYNFSSANYSSTTGGSLTASFTPGDSTYDAAAAVLGGTWCMPTSTQFNELLSNCTWTWGAVGSVNGYTVTGPNGNYIFLPASGSYNGTSLSDSGTGGYYWSTTYNGSSSAYCLYFGSSSKVVSYDNRYCGLSIRAVRTQAF